MNSIQSDCAKTTAVASYRRWLPLLLGLALIAATVAAYWPVSRAEFINYDDNEYVTLNPHVQAGLTKSGFLWALTANHASNWHPLTWWSHMLDVTLFGTGPLGPHLVNLFWHCANSILLLLWLYQLTQRLWHSLFVAALFALHPVHVESVAWVSERKDVLSTFFGLVALIAYHQFAIARNQTNGKPKVWYLVTFVVFALGLMAKPMLVTWPFVFLLVDVWPMQRWQPARTKDGLLGLLRLVGEKTPFFMLSAAASVATTWAQKKTIAPLEHFPLPDRLANIAVSYCRYLGKLFWPDNLALPYLHPGPWPDLVVAASAVTLVILTFLACWWWRRKPFFAIGWFWFLGTLIPVIGLVQVGIQTMADRYTYIPSIGIFVAAVWLTADRVIRGAGVRIAAGFVGAGIVATCSWLTHRQASYWRDTETLFTHSAIASPNNFVALSNVGGALFEKGKLDEALEFYQKSFAINPHYPEVMNSIGAVFAAKEQPDEAIYWFREALTLQPNHPDALFNLGNAYAKKNQPAEAAEFFRAALRVKPENYEAANNLGNVLFKLRSIDAAIAAYQTALDHNPYGALIHKNLGEALAARGKLDDAIFHYEQALRFTNDAAIHYSLGLTLAVKSRWPEAIERFQATLSLAPTNADAHYNLGYAFRMTHKPGQAVPHLQRAVELRPDLPLAHYNLGCALAGNGQTNAAIAALKEALRLKPDYEEAQRALQAVAP